MRLSSKSKNKRNKLIFELMARGGMRISEVLNLTASDVEDRKLIIRDAKSGKAAAHVFIPQKIADRLKQYIQEKGYDPDDLIFPEYPFGNLEKHLSILSLWSCVLTTHTANWIMKSLSGGPNLGWKSISC